VAKKTFLLVAFLLFANQDVSASQSNGDLLLHYAFEIDEGRVLTDASGSGRFGWLHGGIWVPEGVHGGAIRFDSGDQYIVADDAGLPDEDAPRTMALWVKMDSLSPEPLTSLLTYGTDAGNQMSGIGMDWRSGRANLYFSQYGWVALSGWRMTDPGQWHHLAYVYEGQGVQRFYVDGEFSSGTSEFSGPINTILSGALTVGATAWGWGGPDGGYVDDVRIYGRALTSDEIAVLAQTVIDVPEINPEPEPEPQPEPDTTSDLVLHYVFAEDEGVVIADVSGGERTGSLHGGIWVPEGVHGGAIRFDSGDQYIVADDAGLPQGDAPRTMALWVKLDSLAPKPLTSLLTYGTDAYNQMSGIGMDWRGGRANLFFSQYGWVALSGWRMTEPGRWYHLAHVYEGQGVQRFYVDGEYASGTSEFSGPINTILSGALTVGATAWGWGGPDGGYVDDVRIYGRALTSDEIAFLAKVEDVSPAPSGPALTSTSLPQSIDFQLTIQPDAGQDCARLIWSSYPGQRYEVYWTDDLMNTFLKIKSDIVAHDFITTYINCSIKNPEMNFFKVLLQEAE
jgi:acyl dehydratase